MSNQFVKGKKYTRAEVAQVIGLPVQRRVGGNWHTGYDSWKGEVFVFCNVGTAGRTGHDYPNKWADEELEWFGKTGSHAEQPQIRSMIEGSAVVHVFWRSNDTD